MCRTCLEQLQESLGRGAWQRLTSAHVYKSNQWKNSSAPHVTDCLEQAANTECMTLLYLRASASKQTSRKELWCMHTRCKKTDTLIFFPSKEGSCQKLCGLPMPGIFATSLCDFCTSLATGLLASLFPLFVAPVAIMMAVTVCIAGVVSGTRV